jgi:hypothetical protein
MDSHLTKLAQMHPETRFVRINAEKSPFLAEKLRIIMLPTVALVLKGKVRCAVCVTMPVFHRCPVWFLGKMYTPPRFRIRIFCCRCVPSLAVFSPRPHAAVGACLWMWPPVWLIPVD